MGLVAKIVPKEDCSLWIWQITENEEELSIGLSADIVKMSKDFKALSRRLEWLSVRQIIRLSKRIEHISYDATGKPEIQGFHLSISHCSGYSAVYLSPDEPVGLDLEPISGRVLKVANRFMSVTEKERFGNENTELLTLLWSAKEAIFKKHGGETTFFSKNIEILSVDESEKTLAAKVKTEAGETMEKLRWDKLSGTYLVYTVMP